GPTGSTTFTSFGFFYSSAGGTIVPGNNLPLSNVGIGTTSDLILGINSISINTPGVYLVNYYYSPLLLNPGNIFGDVQLILNGLAVPGTEIYSNPSPPTVPIAGLGSQPATGTALIVVTTAGSILTLQNIAANGGSIILAADPLTSTQITLVKIG
ncbi:hypothetical protein CN488_29300, partial [Bacillus anthracis]